MLLYIFYNLSDRNQRNRNWKEGNSFEFIHREIHSRIVQLRLLAAMIKEAWPTFLESEVSCHYKDETVRQVGYG